MQKWAFALGHGDGPPFRPPPPQTVEEARPWAGEGFRVFLTADKHGTIGVRVCFQGIHVEALAMMNMSLPRLVVGASNLQAGLRDLVPPSAAVCAEHLSEEELQEAEKAEKQEAELRAEAELNLRNITIDELYSVVPHVEHLIYQASCLLNSIRSSVVGMVPGPVVKPEPPFEASEPVPAM